MKYLRLSSIVQELLAQKITQDSIQLAVGELILDEAQLQKEWREVTKPTPLANTKLNIRIIAATQQCMWCFLIYHPKQGETTCPQCHSVGAKILSGEEFYLDSF